MTTATLVTVHKLDVTGRELIAWEGRLAARTATAALVDTHWRHEARDLGYARFEPGDHFIESYFADRWYTVYEIRAAADDALKGWYCNITRPATIEDHEIWTVDLALDLWVDADGRTLVLDEDEFQALPLTPADRDAAQQALAELERLASEGALPSVIRNT